VPAARAEVEGVFVIEDGKAKWVPVEVGIAGDRFFEVIRGLNAGDDRRRAVPGDPRPGSR
jgi:hypothetical protein